MSCEKCGEPIYFCAICMTWHHSRSNYKCDAKFNSQLEEKKKT